MLWKRCLEIEQSWEKRVDLPHYEGPFFLAKSNHSLHGHSLTLSIYSLLFTWCQAFNQLTLLPQTYSHAFYQRAIGRHGCGKCHSARDDLNRAAELTPKDLEVLHLRAVNAHAMVVHLPPLHEYKQSCQSGTCAQF